MERSPRPGTGVPEISVRGGERDHTEALATDLVTKQVGGRSYEEGTFEIVLTPER